MSEEKKERERENKKGEREREVEIERDRQKERERTKKTEELRALPNVHARRTRKASSGRPAISDGTCMMKEIPPEPSWTRPTLKNKGASKRITGDHAL